jgi:ABC-type polar amino acid transport system ATPase subunit
MLGDSMIEAEHLTKSFGSLVVLDGLSFRVDRGEFVAVLGPSDVGRSTLLRCLNGLVRPTGGSVPVDGVAFDRGPLSAVRHQLGFIFQRVDLHGNLSMLSNVRSDRLTGKATRGLLFSKAAWRGAGRDRSGGPGREGERSSPDAQRRAATSGRDRDGAGA